MHTKQTILFLLFMLWLPKVANAQAGIIAASGFVSNNDVSLVFAAGETIGGTFENESMKLVVVNIPELKVLPTTNERLVDLPKEFGLSQNYPNPFNPSTNINYALPTSADVSIDVFNVLGKKVASLVNQKKAAGKHAVQFQATNLASGVYFYTLRIDGKVLKSQKMLLIK